MELEVIEEYELLGTKRFRVRIRGTKIVVNVAAESRDEAVEKARSIVKELQLDELLRSLGEEA